MENYNLELSERIWKFNESRALGLSTLSIYFFLLKISVEIDSLKFTISDTEVSKQLKMTRKTVKVCKEKLRRFGIISYRSISGIPAEITLISDYPLILDNQHFDDDLNKKRKAKKQNEEVLVQTIIFKTPVSEIDDISRKKIMYFPTLEEFIEYAESIETYDDNLLLEIKNKHQTWINNGWKNSFDRPITNWKSALKNSLP
ncbi:hypothetical protein SAMN05421847_1413 [Halpernia humi]|uniref:Helix-turn-helix domain-containing protein n=1 Tax=Halpernia humi TaxID=493375 RepID=A0A1H5X379_9FLAO|nr:hypothetical protein [Halpernia humi]SEG05797.1 hypothetical protein SAMN05421847_1413 [Halpernia humi]